MDKIKISVASNRELLDYQQQIFKCWIGMTDVKRQRVHVGLTAMVGEPELMASVLAH